MSDLFVELLVVEHEQAERVFVEKLRRYELHELADRPELDDGLAEGLARAIELLGGGDAGDRRRAVQAAAWAELDVGTLGPARARRALRRALAR